jgi:nucleoside-diphosphate-sugar epimerase/putative sterol carrier protein
MASSTPKIKVAVTGGSGQLGTLVLRRLIDDRKVSHIVSVDVVPPLLVSRKLVHVSGDVRDPEIGRHFAGCDALVHLAFVVTSWRRRDEFDDINVAGSRNVFRAAVSAGIEHIVYSSSVAAYGVSPDHPNPILEETPRVLVDDFPYSAAKYRVEAMLDELERAHPRLRVARMRPTILIGTRLNNPLARGFGKMIDRGLVLAPHDVPLPVVWDEDVADAVQLALHQRATGAFNLNAGEVELAAFARANGLRLIRPPRLLLATLAQVSPRLARLGVGEAIDPAWQKFGRVRMNSSSAKAIAELGWRPKHATGMDVFRHYLAVAPGALDRRIAVFMRLAALQAERQPPEPELTGMSSVVHIALTGRGGGDFTATVADRRISIRPGAPRPPTSIATMTAASFLDLVSGKVGYPTLQLTGKIRIEGDSSAAFLLPALATRFNAQATSGGIKGRAVRAMSHWLGSGSAAGRVGDAP